MPSSALSLAASEASTLSNMTAKEYPHRTRLLTKTDKTIKINNNFRDSSIPKTKKALEQDLKQQNAARWRKELAEMKIILQRKKEEEERAKEQKKKTKKWKKEDNQSGKGRGNET